MSDDLIQITVDGTKLQARKGQMLIEVTDQAGIDVPRFCYHKKLSVAANCRMCLVDVEKAPKPLPACATPVMPNMVVHTRSELAKNAQKGTMEFLLINHPLDCPVCDQGGECELQDVALSYGESASDYVEGKRVVMDKYIGPLIATEMTRCIHCTRCVRFGEEIAGVRELGATGRGENLRIGTYIEKSVVSELSGNIIDLCPVGALTAKPSRFSSRAWELSQHESISPHDSMGANTFIHTDKGVINRVVPRENEAVNEVWISDRDRFAYQGLNAADRALTPLLRIDGKLQTCDWETALNHTVAAIEAADSELSAIVSAYATIEEQYLAQKLVRSTGSSNIDHRIGQMDFQDQEFAPVMPWLGMEISGLENLKAALLIGSNIRKEHPIAGLRLRKAALDGAQISLLNTLKVPLHFDAFEHIAASPQNFLLDLAAIAKAAGASLNTITSMPRLNPLEKHERIAKSLNREEHSHVVLGPQVVSSAHYSLIRLIAAELAEATGSQLVYLPEAGNTCGAWLSGCIPHRKEGGVSVSAAGKTAWEILSGSNKALILMGVEPELDAANPAAAMLAIKDAGKVIVISNFVSESIQAYADIVLPQSVFTESSGTYVNASGRWQFCRGAVSPLGSSRPGWKILRSIASLLEKEGFDYESSEQIRQDLKTACESIKLDNQCELQQSVWPDSKSDAVYRVGTTPIYSTDPIVRRATALQNTSDAKIYASIHPSLAESLKLINGDNVKARQESNFSMELTLRIDDAIPSGCVGLPTGVIQTSGLGNPDIHTELEKV